MQRARKQRRSTNQRRVKPVLKAISEIDQYFLELWYIPPVTIDCLSHPNAATDGLHSVNTYLSHRTLISHESAHAFLGLSARGRRLESPSAAPANYALYSPPVSRRGPVHNPLWRALTDPPAAGTRSDHLPHFDHMTDLMIPWARQHIYIVDFDSTLIWL